MIPKNIASHTESAVAPVPPVAFDFGRCLEFDGVDDNVSFTKVVGQDTWAVSVFMKSDTASTALMKVVGHITGNNYIQINNSLGFIVRSIDGTQKFFAIPAMSDSTWYHLVISVNELSCRCYLNGVESTTGAATIASNEVAELNQFSKIGAIKEEYTAQTMDEFGLWYGSYLTQSDVDTLYNNGDGSDVSEINNSTLWVGTHLNEEGTERASENLGSSGTLTLNGYADSDTPWICHETGEAALVVQRMTAPSGAFINGICEYVESEQAADGDNWDLTDEVQAFNVDSSVNALTGWKQWDCFIDSGSPTFVTYKGYDFISANTDSLVMDFLFGVNSLYDIDDAFVGADFTSLAKGTTIDDNQRIIHEPTNSLSLQIKYSGEIQAYINKIGDVEYDVSILQKDSYFLMVALDSSPYGKYYKEGNLEDISTGARTLKPTGNFVYLGKNKSTNSQYLDGTIRLFTIGAGIGFDPVSNSAAVRRFADRMLIQKHIIAVNTVLSRYTDLTDREVFALGRLVARSEENGNWDTIDEFYPLNLYDETNSLIGTKGLKTATLEDGTPVHVSGLGWDFDGTQSLNSNFEGDIDGVKYLLDDYYSGCILKSGDNAQINKTPFGTRTGAWSAIYNNFGLRGYAHSLSLISASGTMWEFNQQISLGRNPTVRGEIYRNGVVFAQNTAVPTDIPDVTYYIGAVNRNDGIYNGIDGIVACFFVGGWTGLDIPVWNTEIHQFTNELEIGKAHLDDWDIASETYYWDSRELLADQLEELVTIINANCDSTTLGRTLAIRENLGITINAQTQIDDMTGNKNWVVITV